MIVVILKNVILVLLIILIVHFMLKNKLIDDNDEFMRKIVQKELIDKVSNKIEEEDNQMKVRKTNKKVQFEETNKEIERECDGQVKCEDYFVEGNNEEDKMKELYDFVFDKEDNNDGSLNKFFPSNVEDKTITDRTEIDQHINDINMEKDDGNCQFEIIGVIEEKTDIHGLDTLSTTNYSSLM